MACQSSILSLPEDLLSQIALRLDPADPADLMSVSMICKKIHKVIVGKAFRLLYTSHHKPPLLGIFANQRFIPTGPKFLSPPLPSYRNRAGRVLDARHGWVLLHFADRYNPVLMVWNLSTGQEHLLPRPPRFYHEFAGCVMCASPTFPYHQPQKHFKVVFLGVDVVNKFDGVSDEFSDSSDEGEYNHDEGWASVYHSDTCKWDSPYLFCDPDPDFRYESDPLVCPVPPLLVNSQIYFMMPSMGMRYGAYTFNLNSKALSILAAPVESQHKQGVLLCSAADGPSYAALTEPHEVSVWSWGDNSWSLCQQVNLRTLLPVPTRYFHPPLSIRLVGALHEARTIFIGTYGNMFAIRLDCLDAKRLVGMDNQQDVVIPLMWHCLPCCPPSMLTIEGNSAANVPVTHTSHKHDDDDGISGAGDDFTDDSGEKQAPTPKKREVVGKKRASEAETPSGKKSKIEQSDQNDHTSTDDLEEQTPIEKLELEVVGMNRAFQAETPSGKKTKTEEAPPPLPMATLVQLSSSKMFGGHSQRFRHQSASLGCPMTFSIYLPPSPLSNVPVLYWLSGFACTDEDFMTKAHAQHAAALHSIALVAPDTSPRGLNIEGESDSHYFGVGAGFYLNATNEKWKNWRMYDYVVNELPKVLRDNFEQLETSHASIFGHSMGGHGALTIYLKNTDKYKSVSAFSPIVSPVNCPWGQNAFSSYLGPSKSDWEEYDATCLIRKNIKVSTPILIDQGDSDEFMDDQLLPSFLEEACKAVGAPLTLRMQPGYDHSYCFISTFVDDHISHHAQYLKRA